MKERWKMKKALAVKKNLDLLNEFMRYAFENPKILDGIPPEAELIILPTDDPELYEYNKKTADKITAQGRKVIFVKMKKPEISIPELELMSAPLQ
jgi:hypothetical protein